MTLVFKLVRTFNVAPDRQENEGSRQDDLERIEQGADTSAEVRVRNGLFSAIDPSRVPLVGIRRRIMLVD